MDVEIRSKQKELADLQESKTQQLIASIANLELRNKDLQKKHQILVEDYSYNLELLEAKDAEMGRLDALVKASQDDRDAAEHRVKSLLLKIEALESKELERACKAKEDRARNQVHTSLMPRWIVRDASLSCIRRSLLTSRRRLRVCDGKQWMSWRGSSER